jgi:Copper type II ascorbate-dependent monooxygenase, C-terminal domain
MKISRLFVGAASSLCILLGINACQQSENEDTKIVEKSTIDFIQDRILTPKCATSGCHASEQDASFKQHGLVLAKGASYNNLVNIDPKNANAIADKLKRVLPGYSLSSLLFHKLNFDGGLHHGGKSYGIPMPLGRDALFKGEIEYIRRWIDAGAPRTGNVADTTLLADRTPSYVAAFTPLEKPSASEGLQMKLGPFDVAPNFERELFMRKAVGNPTDLYVNRAVIKMRPGSHHFILHSFRDLKAVYMPPFDQIRDLRNPDKTMNLVTVLSMSNHVFWVGTQTSSYDYTFPDGMALLLPANSSFDLNSHYVNKSGVVSQGEIYANLYTVPKEKVKKVVQVLDLGNTALDIPAGKRVTLKKSFTFDKPVNIISLTSHTHQLGEKFVIKINGGKRNGEVVYETTDWEHPDIKTFTTPIVLAKGEGLTSEITYNNTTTKNVRFGLTSEDEMGIIFGYYYEN